MSRYSRCLAFEVDALFLPKPDLRPGPGNVGLGSAHALPVCDRRFVKNIFRPGQDIRIDCQRTINPEQIEVRQSDIKLNVVRDGL